jgi:hypothetical protein
VAPQFLGATLAFAGDSQVIRVPQRHRASDRIALEFRPISRKGRRKGGKGKNRLAKGLTRLPLIALHFALHLW